ncbi:hypothetical protein [Kitasatospora sp. NBC_01266]|uniref:hypothetical protein n=1 Tax=Kitasatospora sp. NBC_01266 TaxID=2903572 RepID=UPI002E2EBD4D|nr:hypothetical protein [Kitasatospora sp. NBC_01266]
MSSARTRSAARWSAAVLTVLGAAVGAGASPAAAATPAPVAVHQLRPMAQHAAQLDFVEPRRPPHKVWNNTGS